MSGKKVMQVFCAIVTYNRCDLLKKAISACLNQTYPVKTLLIIDNNSTDGTENAVREFSDPRISYLRLGKNLGGAGGFSMAMRLFLNSRSDALWIMDDDGEPETESLMRLMNAQRRHGLEILNPLVCQHENHELLSFALGTAGEITTAGAARSASLDGIITDQINPFNGTLITRQLFDKVDVVNPKLFIWGDEVDFQNRSIAAHAKIATAVDALHFHPKVKGVVTNVPFFGGMRLPVESRAHIGFRNKGYLDRGKVGLPVAILKAIRWILVYSLLGKPFMGVRMAAYLMDGYFDKYEKQPRGADILADFQSEYDNALQHLRQNGLLSTEESEAVEIQVGSGS